jgi:hypothetical protein
MSSRRMASTMSRSTSGLAGAWGTARDAPPVGTRISYSMTTRRTSWMGVSAAMVTPVGGDHYNQGMIDDTKLCKCHSVPMYRSQEAGRQKPRWDCVIRRREYARQHYLAHREARIAGASDWNRANPAKRRRTHLKRQYGITPEDYDLLHADQDGRCGICLKPAKLVIDHDHETGCVRGLLCRPCNRSIGQLGEDPEVLRRAADWVSK